MNNSPKILNKKELEKRKTEVYKMINDEELLGKDERLLKKQAKNEAKLIKTEILRKKLEKNEYNIINNNVFLDEFMDFFSNTKPDDTK